METKAQRKATENYRKKSVKQFSLKLFPADQDIIDWLDGMDGKAAYLKGLVRDDMARRNRESYAFETKNMGTCEIWVYGEYLDGIFDVAVSCGGLEREFEEIDAGSVDDIFQWLLDKGVEFEGPRSLWYNVHYVSDVMLDRFETQESLLDRAAAMEEEDLKRWAEWFD